MTTAVRVPRHRWREFFEFLNDMYLGRQLTIEELGLDLGDQILVSDLFLQGFSFDSRNPDADLLIEAGDADRPFVHYVRSPCAVLVAETEFGEEADVQVESADRTYTLVRLRRLRVLPAITHQSTALPPRNR
jgi:Family of unknown function (DUF5335)